MVRSGQVRSGQVRLGYLGTFSCKPREIDEKSYQLKTHPPDPLSVFVGLNDQLKIRHSDSLPVSVGLNVQKACWP